MRKSKAYHAIHRDAIKQMATNQYARFSHGAIFGPYLAGLFCSLLQPWPVWFVVCVLVSLYGMYRLINNPSNSVWDRFVVGWGQHLLLFFCGFSLPYLLILGVLNGIGSIFSILPLVAVSCYNRHRWFRTYYFYSARDYLRSLPGRSSTVSPSAGQGSSSHKS